MSQSVNDLRLDLPFPIAVHDFRKRKESRAELIRGLEYVALKIIKAVAKNRMPRFESINFNKYDNCLFSERLRLKDKSDLRMKNISFGQRKSRHKFAIIIYLLSKIHKLLLTSKVNTRREIYYGNIDLFNSQNEVDNAMRDVCYLLGSPPWELGVISTVKGIVAGPLLFKLEHDTVIKCDKPGGVLIPPNILEVELISNGIQWALLIENDAAFQSIIHDTGLSNLEKYLFITGKGFPDIHTRLLVSRLWECLKIPTLALVDADPYGLEIMCVYRFGSLTSCHFSDRLACPSVFWLGIHPSDIKPLAMKFKSLSEIEAKKMSRIAERSYIKKNEKIKNEVQILIDKNVKAKIEGMSNISSNFITNVYIPGKIAWEEYF